MLYYRLFQENTRGLERELVIREFMGYLGLHREALAEEEDEGEIDSTPEAPVGEDHSPDERLLAGRFLRRLTGSGWLSEEILADFTKVINITPGAKPFLDALVRVEDGLKTEYESHVVTVYSSLCGETVKENGHFMVRKAWEESRALIESLKVLSQSIKGYYDKLNAETVRSEAAAVLHEHYDLYAGEVLDKAYKRLKTSDNVSRYRQGIFKQIGELLKDDEWLEESAGKYLRILQSSREECRKKLVSMLEDIRDDLRSVDPLEDEIDRRNADYSRSSIEIIKAYIEPDSTIAGKTGNVIKAIYNGNNALKERLAHHLYCIRFLAPATLALRRERGEGDFTALSLQQDLKALAKAEADFFERMKRRLSLRRIDEWLDGQGGKDRILFPGELIRDSGSFIRFVYALLYGDSRKSFHYAVEEDGQEEKKDTHISAGGFSVPDVRFRRKDIPA